MNTFDVYNPKLWDFIRANVYPSVVVEIGTFRGAFVRQYIDAGLPGIIYSIDPLLIQGGFLKNALLWHQIVGEYAWKRAFLLRGTSEEWIKLFPLMCDLLYVDGGHSTERALFDLNNWWPRVHKGGIMLVHDMQSRRVRPAVERFSQSIGIPFELFDSGPYPENKAGIMAIMRKE